MIETILCVRTRITCDNCPAWGEVDGTVDALAAARERGWAVVMPSVDNEYRLQTMCAECARKEE
jgi:L-lactate utilization protein LutB